MISDEDAVDNEEIVSKLLVKIKPEFRMCLVLKEMQGLSYEEIAESMNINIGTVKSRLNRAKKQFEKLYEGEVVTYVKAAT